MESSPGRPSFAAAVPPVLFLPKGKNGTETRARAAVPRPNLARKLRRDSPLVWEGELSFATVRSCGQATAMLGLLFAEIRDPGAAGPNRKFPY